MNNPYQLKNTHNYQNSNNKKISFSQKKENTLCSLYEVENFLCKIQQLSKSLKLYNIFK